MHPLGLPVGSPDHRCGDCAWAHMAGPGPKVLRCRASGRRRIEHGWRACRNWEPPPECLDCAACCGPAYDAVEIGPRDPSRKLHPSFFEKADGRWRVRRREGNFCLALQEGSNECAIYPGRPRCCRDFERMGDNCLFARRRLGFSPAWRPA